MFIALEFKGYLYVPLSIMSNVFQEVRHIWGQIDCHVSVLLGKQTSQGINLHAGTRRICLSVGNFGKALNLKAQLNTVSL